MNHTVQTSATEKHGTESSMTDATAVETINLTKRYGKTMALQDCTLELPAGRVAALVGPNAAGKTTLLHLCAGLLEPTAGGVRVFGRSPRQHTAEMLPRLSFVAQDHPLYKDFTGSDLLTMGRRLNPRWDDTLARTRMGNLDIPLDRKIRTLSGGQQAQVALVLALAKRPELLLLDEPLASLDPLARRDFLRTLMDAQLEKSMTLLLSSHIIGDLERVCDYLIILAASHVQLAGDIQEITQTHWRLIGSRQEVEAAARGQTIIEASRTTRQTTLLVRTQEPLAGPGAGASWAVEEVSLEDIVLAYLGQQARRQGTERHEMEEVQ
jgi:ABC-2 type transport system ATP-binding protein